MARLSQSAINRHQYIPPHIQQAISQHLQSTAPGNVQRYMSGGPIPKSAQRTIEKQLSKMPGHLKQYSGAYMEQHVMEPSLNFGHSAAPAQPLAPHPPMPDPMRLDHSSAIPTDQANARFRTNLFAPDQPAPPNAPPSSSEPYLPQEPSNSPPESNPYEFMTVPTKPSRNFNFLSGSSRKQKIILISGGAIALIILFAIVSSILNRSPEAATLESLTAQQSRLIAVSTSASGLATEQLNKNLAINIRLGLGTSQAQIIDFLSSQGHKVSKNFLDALPSSTINQELASAQAQSNYDAIYAQVTQTQLSQYVQSLKQDYSAASSVNEKKLLSTQYQDANILLAQANAALTALQ